jgi:hypothetical protein
MYLKNSDKKGAEAPFLTSLHLFLTTLTFTTIQACQTPIHDDAGFGVTFFTRLRTFWEAFVVDFFTRFCVFFKIFSFFLFYQFLLVLVCPLFFIFICKKN